LVEYVRGSETDKWHWCKNCTQYPMYLYQKTSLEPPSDLCDQCKAKEENGNCQCEEIGETVDKRQLRRELPEFSYNTL
jgi:hypothetical protein